jgi:hypothetical protein
MAVGYLQFTLSVTLASSLLPSGMARFHTAQRYAAPSSPREGVSVNTAVVTESLELPDRVSASRGYVLPSLYHLYTKSRVSYLNNQHEAKTKC